MVFVDHKFVKWDDIDIAYDSDESWVVLHGEQYAKEYINDKEINIVVMPFKCEYIAEESDYSFNSNYEALTNYLQDNSYIENNELYVHIPTMESVYRYNQYPVNVGGWMYYQIKRYHLGLLSEERIRRLRYIPVFKYIRDASMSIVSTKQTRFNALDRDSYTSEELHTYLNYMEFENYAQFTRLRFNKDGLYDSENGEYNIYITNNSTQTHLHDSSDQMIYCDLSDIDNVLFRENYFIFINGYFQADAKIMTSINNIVFIDNPNKNNYSLIAVYDKKSSHVIRNTDRFLKSYMNDKAKKYLEVLYSSNYETETGVHAIDENLEEILFKHIDAYFLDTQVAVVPKLTDYIVYLNDSNTDLINLIHKSIEPFEFSLNKTLPIEESNRIALDAILDYNPNLLKDVFPTYIDSREFTGSQANDNLTYTFMYQSKRGLKIPRKKYKNHETYMMVFVNGELFDKYYKTIAYSNFFFIPVEDDFSFNESDRIEILYFKNVNNNEIRFVFTPWINETLLKQSQENFNYYSMDIFSAFIRPEELQIFSHYPKYMLRYPTLIRTPSDKIAFNISERGSDNRLVIHNSSIFHLTDTYEPLHCVDLEDGTEYDDVELDSMNPNDPLPIELTTDIISVIDMTTGEDLATVYSAEQLQTIFVATSRFKFVYQRLYVDKKSYRIALDKRFRYCDNQRQYILFINGRRMKQDSYLVTIPKYTRPFYDLFLYTARFVNPEDRVELFYVPYEMTDINIDNKPQCEIKPSGYFDYPKNDLDVPLSKDLYLFFVNGKKIPYNDIVDIDSHTVRFITDINTLKYPAVTPINIGSIQQVSDNLRNEDKISKYDSLINFIRTHSVKGYEELDDVFGYYAKMTDIEEDKVWANVAHIAILNEIVRDFWVTSGYDYQNQTFIYDYELDELYERDDENDTWVLPALNATPFINIEKNITSLLYFYTEPTNLLFEKGDIAETFKFYWDYSQRINQELNILSQSINEVEIPIDAREYEFTEIVEEPKNFRFIADTGFRYIVEDTKLDFVNGVYWGTIDEDSLQYYHIKHDFVYVDEIVAVVPKDGYTLKDSIERYKEFIDPMYYANIIIENNIIRNIYSSENVIYSTDSPDMPNDYTNLLIQNVYDDNFIAVVNDNQPDQYEIHDMMYQLLDHEIDNPELYNKEPFDVWHTTGDTMKRRDYNTIREYYDQSDLHQLMEHLEKHLMHTVDIKLNNYIIGNNKYFVFACAKDALYIDHQPQYAEFSFPDIKSEDILANCRDDKTSPIYTNGQYVKETKLLKEIKEMKMEYMGEFPYTNQHGYTTTYVMWKTNGFFTRLFDNYGFNIHIKVGDLDNVNFRINNKTSTSVISYTENNNISSEVIPKRKKLSLNIPKSTQEEDENMDNNSVDTIPDRDEIINDAIINELDNNTDNELGVELIDSLSSSKDKLTDKQIRELLDMGIYLI